jgi:hypothetical protein
MLRVLLERSRFHARTKKNNAIENLFYSCMGRRIPLVLSSETRSITRLTKSLYRLQSDGSIRPVG